jgi:hypothetical protein
MIARGKLSTWIVHDTLVEGEAPSSTSVHSGLELHLHHFSKIKSHEEVIIQ